MSEDALIRRANLNNLKVPAGDLAARLGGTYSYWRDLMKVPTKSFGEKTARRIEEGLGLPRGWLDEPQDEAAAAQILRPTASDTRARVARAVADGPGDAKGKYQPWQLDTLLAAHGRAVTEVATLLPERERVQFGAQLGEHIAAGGTTELGLAFNRLNHAVAGPSDAPPPWRAPTDATATFSVLQRFRHHAYEMAEAHPDPALREVLTTFLLAVEAEATSLPRSGVEATQRGRQPHDN